MYSFIKNIKKVDMDSTGANHFLLSLKSSDPEEDDEDYDSEEDEEDDDYERNDYDFFGDIDE